MATTRTSCTPMNFESTLQAEFPKRRSRKHGPPPFAIACFAGDLERAAR